MGFRVIDNNFQIITCHFCFEIFEIDLEIAEVFSGRNSNVYDCVVCCNPNKINCEFFDGVVTNLIVNDGNEQGL